MNRWTKRLWKQKEKSNQNKINAIASAALVEHRDEILKLENPVDIEMEGE